MQVISAPQAYQFLARLNKEYGPEGGGLASPAQEPAKTGNCTFYSLVIVIAWIQLEHCVNALALIEGVNLLCVLSNTSQSRVSSFALLVPQGEIHAVRPALWLMGEDILLHSRKPERAGHAAHTGEQICLIDGVQRK